MGTCGSRACWDGSTAGPSLPARVGRVELGEHVGQQVVVEAAIGAAAAARNSPTSRPSHGGTTQHAGRAVRLGVVGDDAAHAAHTRSRRRNRLPLARAPGSRAGGGGGGGLGAAGAKSPAAAAKGARRRGGASVQCVSYRFWMPWITGAPRSRKSRHQSCAQPSLGHSLKPPSCPPRDSPLHCASRSAAKGRDHAVARDGLYLPRLGDGHGWSGAHALEPPSQMATTRGRPPCARRYEARSRAAAAARTGS